MTNADYIRSMTNDQLTTFILGVFEKAKTYSNDIPISEVRKAIKCNLEKEASK